MAHILRTRRERLLQLAAAAARPELADRAKELRLPHAVEHDFEPSMWLPSDIETKPEDPHLLRPAVQPRLGGRLTNGNPAARSVPGVAGGAAEGRGDLLYSDAASSAAARSAW